MAQHVSGKYVVGKAFDRDGVRIASGTVVDVTEWPNAAKLLTYRYLRVAYPGEISESTPSVDSVVPESPVVVDSIDAIIEEAPTQKVAAKKAPAKKKP